MFHTAICSIQRRYSRSLGCQLIVSRPCLPATKKKQFGNTATRALDQYPVPVGLPHPQATRAPDQYPILASLPYPSTDGWEVRKVQRVSIDSEFLIHHRVWCARIFCLPGPVTDRYKYTCASHIAYENAMLVPNQAKKGKGT